MSLANIKNYQQGVSLIEILVTTLILGIGLLGVAALQVSSVSSNQEGFFASQATSIAEDYASRIRASKFSAIVPNPTIAYLDFVDTYHNDNTDAFTCAANPNPMCRSDAGNEAGDCSIAEVAIFDKWEVCSLARDTLPQGEVRVLNNGRRLTVVIDWDSTEGRSDIGNLSLVNSNCTILTGSDKRNCVIMELVP